MIISPAFAQTGGASDPFTGLLVPMLVMIVIFYFLVIRPQQQRAKAHRELVDKVRRGDTVITSGGFIGKVIKAADNSDEVEVELSENMRVRLLEVHADGRAGQGRAGKRPGVSQRAGVAGQEKEIPKQCCTSNAGRSSRSC